MEEVQLSRAALLFHEALDDECSRPVYSTVARGARVVLFSASPPARAGQVESHLCE